MQFLLIKDFWLVAPYFRLYIKANSFLTPNTKTIKIKMQIDSASLFKRAKTLA